MISHTGVPLDWIDGARSILGKGTTREAMWSCAGLVNLGRLAEYVGSSFLHGSLNKNNRYR